MYALAFHVDYWDALAETIVRVALGQWGLSSDFRRGENGRKKLIHADNVRVFTSATKSKDLSAATLNAPSGGWPKESSIVVFAQ